MKRKCLAWILTLAMIVSMVGIVPAGADYTPDYSISIVGTSNSSIGTDARSGLDMALNILHKQDLSGVTKVVFVIDSTKLELINKTTGATLALQSNFGSTVPRGAKTSLAWDINYASASSLYAMQLNDVQTIFRFELTYSANSGILDDEETTDELDFALGFKQKDDGTYYTVNDLDPTSIMICDPAVGITKSQTTMAVVVNDKLSYSWGTIDTDDASATKGTHNESLDTLEKPIITINGTPTDELKPNLNGVAASIVSATDASQTVTAINVPALYDENGEITPTPITSVVKVAAKAYKDALLTNALSDEEAAKVEWTYEVGVDAEGLDASTAAAYAASVKQTVSIGNDGIITVSAGAPACTLLITATGQWNDKDAVGNPDRTVTSEAAKLQLCHGDAKSADGGNDPNNPGLNDEDPALRGVRIVDGEKNVLASSAAKDSNYDIYTAAGSTEAIVINGNGFDQYGDDCAVNGTWTASEGAPTRGDDGSISVAAANTGDYKYTFTSDPYSASVTININDYAATWSDLVNKDLTYGEKLTLDDSVTESVTKSGAALGDDATVEFVWKDGDTPDAGTTKVTRQCKVDGVVVAAKDYAITVAKADQNITIVGDTASKKITDFALDEGVATDLNTTVTNAKIDKLIEDGDTALKALATGTSVSYTVSPDDQGIAVTTDENGASIKGDTAKKSATLTITAGGSSNYNETTRVVAVSVVRLLHANITFDPDDENGVIYGTEITATITDGDGQEGSLVGCTYNWGYYDTDAETGETKFYALTAAVSLEATDDDSDGIYSKTVSYTTTKENIDHTLVLQVITPTDKSNGYEFYDSAEASMKHAIIRTPNDADFSTIGTLEVVKTTKDSVIVNYIDGAEYAIVKKDAEAPDDTAYESNETYEEAKNSVVTIKDDDVVEDAKTDSSESGTNDDTIIPSDADENGNLSGSGVTTDENGRVIVPSAIDDDGDDDSATDNQQTDNTDQSGENGSDGEKTDETEGTTTEDGAKGYRFFTLADGTKLEANTEYTVYARIKATDTVSASEPTHVDTKTRKPSYTDPKEENGGGATSEASVALSGTVKVGESLTATITDENEPAIFTVGGENPTATVAWYRIDAEGKETKIENAAGLTYTISGDDKGCQIKVVVTLNENLTYEGTLTATTKDTVPSGYKITGVVSSYNAKNDVTYALYLKGDDGYASTPTLTGTMITAADQTDAEVQTQNFTIEGVADGTYKLIISKKSHANFTILNIVVNGADVHLEENTDSRISTITMGVGDIDGDTFINDTDQSIMLRSSNYACEGITTDEQWLCDLNGDGFVNDTDQSIMLRSDNYSHSTDEDFTLDLEAL